MLIFIKLSLNVEKSNFVIFHAPQKKLECQNYQKERRNLQKEGIYSMLISYALNFIPLEWTLGRDNFTFECVTMHAIQKQEKA